MATRERQGTLVVGLGRSGIGAARLLRALGEPVCLAESRSGDALAEQAAALEAEGIPVKLGLPLDADRFDALTPPPATVVVSPGIRFDHPALEALRARGVAVLRPPTRRAPWAMRTESISGDRMAPRFSR